MALLILCAKKHKVEFASVGNKQFFSVFDSVEVLELNISIFILVLT